MEPEEDLQTMHGIDAEEELIRAMIEEVEPNTNNTSVEDTWSRLRAIVDSWIDRT
jgi:hypothetical protein